MRTPPPTRPWQRHDLARVRPGVLLPPTPAGRWLDHGGMGVVSRSGTPGRVRLGVCPPRTGISPGGGKPPRDACEVAPDDLADVRPPLELSDVLPSAPPAWRDGLAALTTHGGSPWRVFGSLAWQHLHGGHAALVDPATSDVDLLFTPASLAQLDAALDLLRRFPGPPRLDGEAVFPGGLGVSWRELADNPARVLVKHLDGADLRETAALRALLPP